MDTSRPTLQAQAVNRMKTDIAQIVAVLNEWAGKTGKPDFRKAEVNSLCAMFDKYLVGVAQDRHWQSDFVTLWSQFKAAWDDGDGSWTDAKKPAVKLNERFQQVEG